MSLKPGNNPNVIAKNIKTEEAVGKPRKQAVAIALSQADKSRARRGTQRGRGKDGRFIKQKKGKK